MKEIDGDLIKLAKEGMFDVITHGCNCFCTMSAGIAPQIKKAFPEAWKADLQTERGDIKKLGNFSYGIHKGVGITAIDLTKGELGFSNQKDLIIINIYSQYKYGRNHVDGDENPIDYEALTLALRKINKIYSGKTIGLPKIGSGLAGGDWNRIKNIIEKELKHMDVVIIHYKN